MSISLADPKLTRSEVASAFAERDANLRKLAEAVVALQSKPSSVKKEGGK